MTAEDTGRAELVEYVRGLIADWPKPTDEQLDKIAALLRAVRGDAT
ncbi:hypothetical protein [Mycobacterium sp.]